MASSPSTPTPRDIAERAAVRNSERVGALTAFCLFALTWLTGYAWMSDAPLNEASARRDDQSGSKNARGETSSTRGPWSDRRPPTENRARFRSATWRGNSFFARATSERFLTDDAASGSAPFGSARTGQPQPLSLGQAQSVRPLPSSLANDVANSEFHLDLDLPPPQIPVPPGSASEDSVPESAYGTIRNLTPAPRTAVGESDDEPVPIYEELPAPLGDPAGSFNEEAPRLPMAEPAQPDEPSSTDEAGSVDRRSRLQAEFRRLRNQSRGLDAPPRVAARGQLPSGILAEPPSSDGDQPDGDPDSASETERLPSLEEELAQHAGGQMGRSLIDAEHDARLPCDGECAPQPITAFQKFLGNDAVCPGGSPSGPIFENGNWGECGFTHERRLTIYGQYQVFGLAFEEAGQRFDGVGHSATIDVDFRLTGTERVHVQFQPLGRNDEGGSFWKLNDPRSYQDNSSIVPERFWIEGELYSLFSRDIDDQFTPHDWHFVAGKFPFVLHNELLLNDEILGFAVNSNTNMPGTLSNLNVQIFGGRDDTSPFDFRSTIAGIHASVDYQSQFYELTYTHQWDDNGTLTDADYLAASATRFYGPVTLAARAMGRSDEAGDSSGLFVGEANWTRKPGCNFLNAESLVAYATGFHATDGWQSMGGGDFDRLRSNFAVNPLVAISQRGAQADVSGAAVGVQVFRSHEDESWTPELSFENRDTGQACAAGLTFQRKLSNRWFLECSGVRTWTNDATLRDRTGLLLSTTWLL